jgi:ubiquinone/menaquinone biosynthesis C-methylase UbiE
MAPASRVTARPAPAGDADVWFDWLLRARHGDDAAYAATLAPMLASLCDGVLDHAELRPGARIVDVGCGDGFVGFAALRREPTSRVTFVDISPALIEHARAEALRAGVADRCTFVTASAQGLDALGSGTFDVVLVRAVLAYLDDKPAAVRELRRLLRPGGRISIVDPIFQDAAFAVAGIESQRHQQQQTEIARFVELVHRYRSSYYPDTLATIKGDTLTNYNERDLLRIFEGAGFVNIHLRLHIDVIPAPAIAWSAFLASSPRAGVPTAGEVLATRFSAVERAAFEEIFRPRIETGALVERNVNAFIFADAPR